MKENAINEISRDFFAVISGLIVAIAAGALLYPLVNLVVERNLDINFFGQPAKGGWKHDLILALTFFGWLFVASMAGGFVCALISRSNDTLLVLMNALVTIVMIVILSGGALLSKKNIFPSLLFLLGITFGNLLGGWMGGRVKRRRKSTTQ